VNCTVQFGTDFNQLETQTYALMAHVCKKLTS